MSQEDPAIGPDRSGGNDMMNVFNKSPRLLAALLESASQAIIGVDRAGCIVLANRRTEEMFGYKPEELMGNGMELLLPESLRSAHAHERDGYFARPHVRPMGIGMDLVGRRRDGSEFPVEVSLSYIETREGTFAIAFVSDIGQRKRLEEQLMQAQKMEAIGLLAGGVAHDFNNMLTVISGYNRMILDELSALDPLRGYSEEIQQASDRAAAITSQLLTFSRRQVTKPRFLNVNELIGQTEKMLRRLIGDEIELVLNLDPEIGNIKADPHHIEQAIVNLALNSRDAMPSGGRIHIETRNTNLDDNYVRTHLGVEPGAFIMIAVSDTGHGMDAATRRRIFEPFFTTKERGKGTGLGLATVYGMVKQAGGDVWVYSEPAIGSTFKLYFPRVGEAVSEAPIVEAAAPRGHETVLVVEDEKAVRDLTVKLLTQLGYQVLKAAGGKEALEISRAHVGEIALLVTDLVMPGMNGRQVADALRAEKPGISVLYVSGYTENTVLDRGVLDPGVDFLPKPFSRDVLGLRVREILSRP
ncbi:MAG TPA: PAS domain S-box protein [Candidatus Acidoferrales bacterium]|nr:PAS domain S-box protein [Candidatus Acidoferrales bacterium]